MKPRSKPTEWPTIFAPPANASACLAASAGDGAFEDDGLVVGDAGDFENSYRHGRWRPDPSVSGPHHRPDHRQLLVRC